MKESKSKFLLQVYDHYEKFSAANLEFRRKFIEGRSVRKTDLVTDWCKDSPLNGVLKPASLDQFVNRFYAKVCFHSPAADAERFTQYFSMAALKHLIARSGVPTSNVRIIDERQEEQPGSMVGRDADPASLDPRKLMEFAFVRHGSFIITLLDRYDPGVSRLAEEVNKWTNQPVGVNSYFTPRRTRTFKWHWDDHDVMIFQIEGSKAWTIFEPAFPLPLLEHKDVDWPEFQHENSKVLKRMTLHQGDFLYIPAGFPHMAASPKSQNSLHLTIGLYPTRWHGVIGKILRQALHLSESDLAFRAHFSLPKNAKERSHAKIKTREMMRRLSKTIDRIIQNSEFLEDLHSDIQNGPYSDRVRLLLEPHCSIRENIMLWDSLQNRVSVKLSSIATKTALPFQVIRQSDFVELRTLRKSYLFRKDLYRALIFLQEHQTFRVRDLKGLKLDRDKVELMNILKDYALVAIEKQ